MTPRWSLADLEMPPCAYAVNSLSVNYTMSAVLTTDVVLLWGLSSSMTRTLPWSNLNPYRRWTPWPRTILPLWWPTQTQRPNLLLTRKYPPEKSFRPLRQNYFRKRCSIRKLSKRCAFSSCFDVSTWFTCGKPTIIPPQNSRFPFFQDSKGE